MKLDRELDWSIDYCVFYQPFRVERDKTQKKQKLPVKFEHFSNFKLFFLVLNLVFGFLCSICAFLFPQYLNRTFNKKMGSFLEKPQTAKEVEFDENDEMNYGLACMQGWRMEMEDAHTTVLSMPLESLKKWSFFFVFDGHAGAKVAKAASERLLNEILDTEYFKNVLQTDEGGCASENKYDCAKIRESIEQGFLRLDTKLFKEEMASGSTAVGLMITPKHYFYINCGDSRAVHVRNATKGTDWKGLKSVQHPDYIWLKHTHKTLETLKIT